MKLIKGDILLAKEKYIVHQCNCTSKSAAGLAYELFKKFPYANVYARRIANSTPGTIEVVGDGVTNRFIINMFGQYYPSYPSILKADLDGAIVREKYFQSCLDEISKIENLSSIAFPFKIGCGLAGGNWDNYLKMLEDFSINNKKVKVTIYEFP